MRAAAAAAGAGRAGAVRSVIGIQRAIAAGQAGADVCFVAVTHVNAKL